MKISKKQLAAGLSKKEIFEKASVEERDLKKVSQYLAMFPDKEESKKYNKANNILLGIYALLTIMSLFGLSSMFSELPLIVSILAQSFDLLIFGTVIYFVSKKMSVGYFLLSFFVFKGALNAFKGYESDPASVWFALFINIALLIFIVVLKRKLFPHQNFFNTKKDSDGFAIYTKI